MTNHVDPLFDALMKDPVRMAVAFKLAAWVHLASDYGSEALMSCTVEAHPDQVTVKIINRRGVVSAGHGQTLHAAIDALDEVVMGTSEDEDGEQ